MTLVSLLISVIILLTVIAVIFGFFKRDMRNITGVFIVASIVFLLINVFFDVMIILDAGSIDTLGSVFSWLNIFFSLALITALYYFKKSSNFYRKSDEQRVEREAEVLSAIVKAEENERVRFAKELHDGLGPLLSAIKMSVSSVKKQMANSSGLRIIENAEKLIDESIFTIKEISNNISPHILNNFGLLKALQSFINKIQFTNNINIIINSNLEEKRFDYNTEVIFYRVITEMINNTLKHASATKITIDLFEDADNLFLEYIDNGVGFIPEKIETTVTGMGLANMKSRINSLNGDFNLRSNKGKGVCFTIKVKVQ